MATPFLDLVAEIRKLGGAPKVTYPHDDANYPVTERVLKLKRGEHLPTYGQAEPDAARFGAISSPIVAAALVLTEHVELEVDAQWVSVYRKYERIPGKAVTTTRTDLDGKTVTITTQRMLASSITTTDNVTAGTWTKSWKSEGDGYAGTQTTETRDCPGDEYTTEAGVDDNGNNIITKTKLVPAADASSASSSTASTFRRYQATSKAVGQLITVNYPNSFASVSEIHAADDRVPGSRATVTYTIHPTSDTLTADNATTVRRKLKHPTNPALCIWEETVYAVPDEFQEIEDQAYPFPEIFDTAIADETFGTYWQYRPGLSEVRPHRIHHHFEVIETSGEWDALMLAMVPTIIRENAWRLPLGFSGRGLTDSAGYSFTKSGTTIGPITIPDSTPSRTAYLAMVAAGDELFAGGYAKLWRAKIYHVVKLYTIAQ